MHKPAIPQSTILNSQWTPLLTLALLHMLVDAFALFVQPLWPDLQRSFGRRPEDVQWSYVSWSLATSFSQLAFGYLGDRWHSRWLLWLGPALGMISICSIGWIDSFLALNSVLFLGGLGIAAFHPEAAAAAGACLPAHRSRAMAIFAVGGYLGQAAGPLYSGIVTTRFGLIGLTWSLPWGIAALGVLMVLLRSAARLEAIATKPQTDGARIIRPRRGVVALLMATCTLRVLPMLGVPLALAFAIKLQGGDNAEIGAVQSSFLLGIGIGSLASAWLVQPIHERLAMWLLPLLAVPPLLVCPTLQGTYLLAAVCVAGTILGGGMPVLVGYGQQLLPQAQRVASSLTMGVTWGSGGIIVAGVMAQMNSRGSPQTAIYLFAACAAVSSLLSIGLPPVSQPEVGEVGLRIAE